MSEVKTKTELGRQSFEAYVSWNDTRNGVVFWDEQGFERRTLVRPGVVTFAPYSQDGWRAKIRDHRDATTTMYGNRLRTKSTRYSFSSTIFDDSNKRYQSWNGSGDLFATAGAYPSIIGGDPNAVAQATERFIKSLEDATHEIRGASMLAEGLEAVRGLASPAKALRKEVGSLYQTARRRMYRDRNNSLRAQRDVVAGTWLEWNFGVKPLVQDANSAAAALNQLRTRDRQAVFPVKGSARDSLQIGSISQDNLVSPSVPHGATTVGEFDYWVEDWQDVVFRGVLVVDGNPGADVPLASQFGVGFNDVAPAIWEAIPWSWMFDYFFNISAVIDAFGAPLQNLGWANRTVRNGRTHHYSDVRQPLNTKGPGGSYATYFATGGKAEATLFNFTRSSISRDDIRVPLRMKLPGHGTQWANLAALASYGTDLRKLRKALDNLGFGQHLDWS